MKTTVAISCVRTIYYRKLWYNRFIACFFFFTFAMSNAVSAEPLHSNSEATKITVDSRVRKWFQRNVEDYCRNPQAKAIFMIKTGQVELDPNMVENPGFEQVWGVQEDIPEGEEWRRGVAFGWGVTPRFWEHGGRIDTLVYLKEDPIRGWRAGRISNRDGSYGRQVPGVKTGEPYLVQAFVKLERLPQANLEQMPTVLLRVQWWGKKGWLYNDRYNVRRSLTKIGKWVLMELVAIPPQNAKSVRISLSVEGMQDGTEILFDNISFRSLNQQVGVVTQ